MQEVFWDAFEEVHRSNMTKENNGNGKAIKGKDYSPPDLKTFIHSICYYCMQHASYGICAQMSKYHHCEECCEDNHDYPESWGEMIGL